MKMLLANGTQVECACDPSLDPYEMKMSHGANQSIWHLSGKPHDIGKRDRVLRLMAAARGEAEPRGNDEFQLLRLIQLAFHMEWLLGMLAGPDTHKVLVEDPRAMLDSFKALCLDLAQIEQGHAAGSLLTAMDRANQRTVEVKAAMENQALPTPIPATGPRIGGF